MRLKAGALGGVSMYDINPGGNGGKEGGQSAYHKPNVNTNTTTIFFEDFMFMLQTALTGNKRIKTSVIVLKSPLTFNSLGISTQ